MSDLKYLVWCEAYDDAPEDGRVIEAHDAEDAAEKWAEQDDYRSAEYNIVKGNEVVVNVAPHEADPKTVGRRFQVRGETVAVYHARPL